MILQTKRLLLREFVNEDLDALATLLGDEEVMRYSVTGPIREKKKVQEYLQTRILDHYSRYGYGLYAVISQEDQQFIGFIGLLTQEVDGQKKVELGYRLKPAYWGRGLAQEGAQAVCQYAFHQMKMEEVISIIDPKNSRSLSVAKALGMNYWKNDVFHGIPVEIYRLTKD